MNKSTIDYLSEVTWVKLDASGQLFEWIPSKNELIEMQNDYDKEIINQKKQGE